MQCLLCIASTLRLWRQRTGFGNVCADQKQRQVVPQKPGRGSTFCRPGAKVECFLVIKWFNGSLLGQRRGETSCVTARSRSASATCWARRRATSCRTPSSSCSPTSPRAVSTERQRDTHTHTHTHTHKNRLARASTHILFPQTSAHTLIHGENLLCNNLMSAELFAGLF